MLFRIVSIHLHGSGKLTQIARATDPAGIFLRLAQSRQEQRGEYRDDRDHYEELNQGKASARLGPGTENAIPKSGHQAYFLPGEAVGQCEKDERRASYCRTLPGFGLGSASEPDRPDA